MAEIETRASAATELRVAASGRSITWYPIIFDSPSQPLAGGLFIERITRASVTKTLTERDVVADFAHSDSLILGNTRSHTLKLEPDRRGVKATVEVPRARDDVLELVQRGDVSGGSFTFEVLQEGWESGSPPVRVVSEMRLHAVTLTASPAYLGTLDSTTVRAMATALEHRSLDGPAIVTLRPSSTPTRVVHAQPITVREARFELAELERSMNTPSVAEPEHRAVSAPRFGEPYKPLPRHLAWFVDKVTEDRSAPVPMVLEAERRKLEAQARALTVEYTSPPLTSKRFWFW